MPLIGTGFGVERDERAGKKIDAGASRTILGGTTATHVPEGPVNHFEFRIDRRMQPRRDATCERTGIRRVVRRNFGRPGVAGVVRNAVDIGYHQSGLGAAPKGPDHRTGGRVQRKARVAAGIGRADVDHAVVVHRRDLADIAERRFA